MVKSGAVVWYVIAKTTRVQRLGKLRAQPQRFASLCPGGVTALRWKKIQSRRDTDLLSRDGRMFRVNLRALPKRSRTIAISWRPVSKRCFRPVVPRPAAGDPGRTEHEAGGMSGQNGHHGERVIDDIRSLSIPPGWERTRVGEVGEVRLGRQRSPKNRSANFPTKYIRAANITWTGLDLSDVLDMDFRPQERASYRLQPGDVLLSEASGSASAVGKPAIWNGDLEDCCFQNTVIRFRPKARLFQVCADYVSTFCEK